MLRQISLVTLMIIGGAAVGAELPKSADRFSVISPSGVIGQAESWIGANGERLWRERYQIGDAKTDLSQRVLLNAAGLPEELDVERAGAQGYIEKYTNAAGRYAWAGPFGNETGPSPVPAFYVASSAPVSGSGQLLIETILKAPGRTLALLPRGTARAERLADLTVGKGAAARTVTLWAVEGIGISPIPLWATADGRFFASIEMPTPVPAGYLPEVVAAGYENAIDALRAAQAKALADRSARIARNFATGQPRAIAFTNVRAFIYGKFVEGQTVVVRGGKITAVGAAAATRVPEDATIIDGAGKTLVPGLWDFHHHVVDDSSGPFLLSLGITTIRDPSNDNSRTISRWRRQARGELLFPRVFASALIDGPGPNSTQTRPSWVHFGTVVNDEAEAVKAVRDAKAQGFTGIKFYGSMNPKWIAPSTAEAHRLGLRAHGHLPAGFRASQAIAAGYDEITHAYFLMMEAMPDAIVASSQTRNRFEGNGRFAKDVDLTGGVMADLARTMAARHISADPTLVVVEWILTAKTGEIAPAYAAYAHSAPPMVQRRFRLGAIAREGSQADRIASFAKDREMVGMLHRAGVTVTAGTDSSGLELVRELEFYVQQGFTPAEALESASIVPARLMHVDGMTGSIAVGKAADLLLVEGDPSRNIGDLRNARTVVAGGKLLNADALRKISGFTDRPR